MYFRLIICLLALKIPSANVKYCIIKEYVIEPPSTLWKQVNMYYLHKLVHVIVTTLPWACVTSHLDEFL